MLEPRKRIQSKRTYDRRTGGVSRQEDTDDESDATMICTERLERFDFIEIGTCDFDTIIQTCPDAWRGLSVDAVQLYLDRLPDKANVTKVCCGVTGATKSADERTDVFYIQPDDIARNKLPSWLRGCNSIKKPHPTALWKLRPATFWKLCRRAKVPLYSMEQLMNKYGVGSVDFLKIDAEGHDCNILQGLVRHCLLVPSRWPRRIQFECNFLTKPSIVNDVIYALEVNGNYKLISRTKDDCMMERDETRVFFSHRHYRYGGTYDQLVKNTNDAFVPSAGAALHDVPLNIFQFWDLDMPPIMKRVTDTLRAQNPEFTYHLFDEHMAEAFIEENFHARVVEAYRRLIPLAYKCDLFRYCVLYVRGGIYLDVGYECVNGFRLIHLLDGSFVLDMKHNVFKGEHIGVWNGCMVSQPKSLLLKRCIERVVDQVEKRTLGHSRLYPTGPGLLGMIYEQVQPDTPFNMCFTMPDGQMQLVMKNNTIVLQRYKDYRSEQTSRGSTHYHILWAQRRVYKSDTYLIDVSTPFLIE
jgi:hypothetical protein